jgi:hypothetical protein
MIAAVHTPSTPQAVCGWADHLVPIPDDQIPVVTVSPCRICCSVPIPVQDTQQDHGSLRCCQGAQPHGQRHRTIGQLESFEFFLA